MAINFVGSIMKARDLKLENRFTAAFPADPETDNHRRQVTGAAYSWVYPRKASAPVLLAVSEGLAGQLDLQWHKDSAQEWAEVFSGSKTGETWKPYAACYGGHQFGQWAGQLGDGRAINLGELKTNTGYVTLQLKGSGPTPYSRNADGFAVLRSSVREFLCSEAMYYLGIPTTRALCLVATGDQVLRDMMYDGNAAYEPGAVVCRVAADFIRFGNFEIFAARQEHELLRAMADYTITHHYAHLGKPGPETYLAFFNEVAEKTLDMIIHWLRVGFVHGVMNTDNMSVLGLTIDYGPYGWLEAYDENWTPNTTDRDSKRYAFGQQANISLWNLWKLGNALYPLIGKVEGLQHILERYPHQYRLKYEAMMRAKLGLFSVQHEDISQIRVLLDLMARDAIDYNLFFRGLSDFVPEIENFQFLNQLIQKTSYLQASSRPPIQNGWEEWMAWYAQRLSFEDKTPDQKKQLMNATNPAFIVRNYMAHEAIQLAEKGDNSRIQLFLELMKKPYESTPENEVWMTRSPDWSFEKPGCSMLSCSS